MGAHPWHYFVTYQEDLNEALQLLREWEFLAGRYGKSFGFLESFEPFIIENDGEINPRKTAMNLIKEYGGVEEAISAVVEAAEKDGTASILDIFCLSEIEEYDAVCPLQSSELIEIFGTLYPSVQMVKSTLIHESTNEWVTFWESIGRGTGRYIIYYEAMVPREIFFAGYSFD